MSGKKTFLIAMACVFGALALILYFTSIKELDRETARYLGTGSVANIPGMIFSAACAVLCGLNVIGAVIISAMEENTYYQVPSSGNVANEVVRAIKHNEQVENQKRLDEEKAKEEQKEREERARARMEEMKARRENGEVLEEEVFLEEIKDEQSMMNIWKLWKERGLGDIHPEAEEFIKKYKDMERLYGKQKNMDELKEQLGKVLLS